LITFNKGIPTQITNLGTCTDPTHQTATNVQQKKKKKVEEASINKAPVFVLPCHRE